MSLPVPNFDDDDEDGLGEIDSEPTDTMIALSQDRQFRSQTPNGLFYDSDHPIYRASSCNVYLSRSFSNPPHYYALKSSHFVKRIRNEYNNFQLIGDFDTIIRCYDHFIYKGTAFLQLELAQGGSVRPNLSAFSSDEAWRLLAHISLALAHIHSKNLMHLDVSPSNILKCTLPNGKEVYKLSDFGTTLPVGEFTEDCEGAGPYVSPEALGYPHLGVDVTTATDIFSFGIVMMEIVTKKNAPRSCPGYENLRKGEFDFSGIPGEFDVIKDMLAVDPEDRPTADDILEIDRVAREVEILKETLRQKPVEYSYTYVPQTPSHRPKMMPPETPYSQKYARRRKAFMDDDF